MTPYLFLGQQRTLYLGPLAPRLKLSLAASRLLVALDGAMVIRTANQQLTCRSALLPVGGRFTIEFTGLAADCHLDVLGADFGHISPTAARSFRHGGGCDLTAETTLIDTFSQLAERTPAPADMAATLADLLGQAAAPITTGAQPDPRIVATINYIQQTVTGNPPLSELADHAGLSRSRLASLFRNQVGVPIRRYRLWHRLFVACTHLAVGTSITSAAHLSGFSDTAHLSHTFRDILGISPSDLFGQPDTLRVAVEPMASLANGVA